MSEKLSKKQVCRLLGIGYSTLGTWMREGKIKFERDTTAGKFESAVWFDKEEAAKFLPSVTDSVIHPSAPKLGELLPAPARPAPAKESRDIRTWAEKYKDGDAADSCGNRIDGTNERFITEGTQTLLGPTSAIDHGPPVDTQAHMDNRLLGTHDTLGNPVSAPTPVAAGYTRSGSALADGLSQEAYDAMLQGWRRSGGGRSMSEQELAIRRSREAINRSFPR
jgi:hypothetical protein